MKAPNWRPRNGHYLFNEDKLENWQTELFWVIVGASLTAFVAVAAAVLNWHSQRHKILSDKAWADYELRRDVYLDLVAGIDCLFTGGNAEGRSKWHETARKVRIVGSDEVVMALNALTAAIKENSGDADQRLYSLNLALRRDIRDLRSTPSEGTKLEAVAFPIES